MKNPPNAAVAANARSFMFSPLAGPENWTTASPISVAASVTAGSPKAAASSRRRALHWGRSCARSAAKAMPMITASAKAMNSIDQFMGLGASREPRVRQSIGQRMEDPVLDCLIVGGGPAGLTAAIYLARFHLGILVVDGGKSRAAWIPCTRNVSGFTDGIAGPELLQRMRDQACKYGAKINTEFVTKLERDPETGLFTATWGSGCRRARSVLLATGVTNRRAPMEEELHEDALRRGLIRYCPICDGYEVTDRKVGVIGSDSHGVAEALFIRSYTADVTLIAPDKAMRLRSEDLGKLKAARIECVDGPAQAVAISREFIVVETVEGTYTFDSVYSALGSDTHVQLAEQVGADLSPDHCIKVDAHQRTSVPGLYAAGDVVIGLDQISHAMGQGGVAATTMRNDLERQRPLWREAVQRADD